MWQTGIYFDDLHGLWGIHQLDPWLAIASSLVLGVGLINVMNLIDGVDGYSSGYGMLASVCFAVLLWSPWFDTMRVTFMRILRGKSPFRPDKTHMHHLFIDMGFSHLGAAFSILLMNLSVVLVWLVSWHLGASIEVGHDGDISSKKLVLSVFFQHKYMNI